MITVYYIIWLLEACSNGDVRMVGSPYSLSGRVEFCNKFTWRSICSTKWSYNEASVTCGELNMSPYGIIIITLTIISVSIAIQGHYQFTTATQMDIMHMALLTYTVMVLRDISRIVLVIMMMIATAIELLV